MGNHAKTCQGGVLGEIVKPGGGARGKERENQGDPGRVDKGESYKKGRTPIGTLLEKQGPARNDHTNFAYRGIWGPGQRQGKGAPWGGVRVGGGKRGGDQTGMKKPRAGSRTPGLFYQKKKKIGGWVGLEKGEMGWPRRVSVRHGLRAHPLGGGVGFDIWGLRTGGGREKKSEKQTKRIPIDNPKKSIEN